MNQIKDPSKKLSSNVSFNLRPGEAEALQNYVDRQGFKKAAYIRAVLLKELQRSGELPPSQPIPY